MTLTVSKFTSLMSEVLSASHHTSSMTSTTRMLMLLTTLSTATAMVTVSVTDTVTATSEELIFQALILNLVRTIRSRTFIFTVETREQSSVEKYTKDSASKSALLEADRAKALLLSAN